MEDYHTEISETEIRDEYHRLTRFLIQQNLTITTMESATSGQIASLLTDTEGASQILKGAFITYSNEAKIRQGVSAEIIKTYSVYSEETARAMAQAAMDAYQADISIGVTGNFGNIDPANKEASVPGVVYFAIAIGTKMHSYTLQLVPQPDRLAYKLAVAHEIYKKGQSLFANLCFTE